MRLRSKYRQLVCAERASKLAFHRCRFGGAFLSVHYSIARLLNDRRFETDPAPNKCEKAQLFPLPLQLALKRNSSEFLTAIRVSSRISRIINPFSTAIFAPTCIRLNYLSFSR